MPARSLCWAKHLPVSHTQQQQQEQAAAAAASLQQHFLQHSSAALHHCLSAKQAQALAAADQAQRPGLTSTPAPAAALESSTLQLQATAPS